MAPPEDRTETVTLKQPAVVHDVLRNPIEGSIAASKSEADRLHAAGLLVGDDDRDDDQGDENVPDDLKGLKVHELKAKALKDGVPLHDATKKADIIAAFVAHRAKD